MLVESCHMSPPAEGMSDAALESFRGSVKVEEVLSGMTLEDKVGEMMLWLRQQIYYLKQNFQ